MSNDNYKNEKNDKSNKNLNLKNKKGEIIGNEINKDQISDDRLMLKYLIIATNIMYTLCGPIFLMCLVYFGLKKYIFQKEQPIILIIFIFLGGITGYWSLIKQLTKLNK